MCNPLIKPWPQSSQEYVKTVLSRKPVFPDAHMVYFKDIFSYVNTHKEWLFEHNLIKVDAFELRFKGYLNDEKSIDIYNSQWIPLHRKQHEPMYDLILEYICEHA